MNEQPQTTRQAGAFERGQMAKRKGLEAAANPHSKKAKPVDHDWWLRGYESEAS